jgi:hypothetical protein
MPYLAATAKTANSCDRTAAGQHTRHKPVHHNDYVRLYSVIQEIDKPLAFHAGYHWQDASLATSIASSECTRSASSGATSSI